MSERPAGPVAYTDGACIGNPGPGGWAVHVEYPGGRVLELAGAELETTNNRMELRAAIEAARATAVWPAATIVTDSQYVLRGITEWLAGWKRQGWRTTTGQPVLNRDLWEELDEVAGGRLTWEWARGHSGVPGNERCDAIASWFAGSVQSLDGPRAAPRASARRGTAAPSPNSATPGGSGVSYVSVVDGIPARHATWAECERRVKGVKSARFKKVRSAAEEQETFSVWGVTPEDLYGI
jgi:ribonuclease HI